VKGACLSPDQSFEVLQGVKTLPQRMMGKCINTQILAQVLGAHPKIKVNCNGLPGDPNHALLQKQHYLGLPAPLFTADFGDIPRPVFQQFFDNLSPTFAHMISLGQNNTIISCPALTTHSELSDAQLKEAGIAPAMVRFAVGDESPMDLVSHLVNTAEFAIDPHVPGYSKQFPTREQVKEIIRKTYVAAHSRHVEALC
jgi:O-acetylhomoserine/O-acetylserine sulfhydrylase-like pyridoxal-dependent enzyme